MRIYTCEIDCDADSSLKKISRKLLVMFEASSVIILERKFETPESEYETIFFELQFN